MVGDKESSSLVASPRYVLTVRQEKERKFQPSSLQHHHDDNLRISNYQSQFLVFRAALEFFTDNYNNHITTMDDAQQPTSLATAFPAPPPFWTSFTPENLERIQSLRATSNISSSKTEDASKSLPLRILDLPVELRNLQPPEPPADGHFRCFGDQFWVPVPFLSPLV